MPPKMRDAAFRRRAEQAERARALHRASSFKGNRSPKAEAYDRNKRNAAKVQVRRDWVDW